MGIAHIVAFFIFSTLCGLLFTSPAPVASAFHVPDPVLHFVAGGVAGGVGA